MIEFHQFGGAWGMSSASPFCVKLEACLRYWKIPYQTFNEQGMGKAPKGKMPYVVYEGETIGDSGLIASRLVKDGHIPEGEFDATTRARHLAFQRLIEEHLYWALVWFRWIDDDNFKILCDRLFAKMPGLLRAFLPKIFRNLVRKNLKSNGMGRHHRDEIATMAQDNINALADELGEKDYFCGDQPHLLDMAAFGLLIQIVKTPMRTPLQEAVLARPNLVQYCEKMEQAIFPEYVAKSA